MKIVLWIGNEANQRALASKIHNQFPVTAIITETKRNKKNITFGKIIEKGIEKLILRQIGKAWFDMLEFYNKMYPGYPDTPIMDVENINSNQVYEFTKSINPDLVLVSGTRLIKKKLLSIKPSLGILNLHTGLSPYIKGGPNCTNWCIATRQFHLIGNTIMWIDEGIDSGNILTTEFTTFTGGESLEEIHIKVMEQAHDLYLRGIASLHHGLVISVPQSQIAPGITYYNKQWGLKEKIKLVRNLKHFKKVSGSAQVEDLRKNITVVPLEKKFDGKESIVYNL